MAEEVDETSLGPLWDTNPDAVIQGNTVLLCAERAGTGNGRVYQVHFTADDGRGWRCSGTVAVKVPATVGKGSRNLSLDVEPFHDLTTKEITMDIFRTLMISFLLIPEIAIGGMAHAAELFTPPLEPDGTNRLDCRILNISSENRTVRTRVVDNNGTVVVDTGDFILGPGATAVAFFEANAGTPRHCHFTVQGKNPQARYRASACVFDPGVGCLAAVSALDED